MSHSGIKITRYAQFLESCCNKSAYQGICVCVCVCEKVSYVWLTTQKMYDSFIPHKMLLLTWLYRLDVVYVIKAYLNLSSIRTRVIAMCLYC